MASARRRAVPLECSQRLPERALPTGFPTGISAEGKYPAKFVGAESWQLDEIQNGLKDLKV
jgi:hypothetical protein